MRGARRGWREPAAPVNPGTPTGTADQRRWWSGSAGCRAQRAPGAGADVGSDPVRPGSNPRSSKRSRARQDRTSVSWTTSSASWAEPSIRRQCAVSSWRYASRPGGYRPVLATTTVVTVQLGIRLRRSRASGAGTPGATTVVALGDRPLRAPAARPASATLDAEVGKLARHLGERFLEVASALLEQAASARLFLVPKVPTVPATSTAAATTAATAAAAMAAASLTELDVVSSHRLHHGASPSPCPWSSGSSGGWTVSPAGVPLGRAGATRAS